MIRSFIEQNLKNSSGKVADWAEGKEVCITGKVGVELKTARNKSKYLLVTITDKENRSIATTIFEQDELYEFFNDFVGTKYKCSADVRFILVKKYKSMVIQNIKINVPSEEEIKAEENVLNSEIKNYKAYIKETIQSIKTPILHTIVTAVYKDANLVSKLFTVPATLASAYTRRGGLCHMIADSCMLAESIVETLNSDSTVTACSYNLDLIKAGVLLCNVGRAYTIGIDLNDKPEKTEIGLVNSDVTVSRDIVVKTINTLQRNKKIKYDFNCDLINDLLHMISSSKSKLEYGAVSVPRSKHAMLLSNIMSLVYTKGLFENLEQISDGGRRIKAEDYMREYILFDDNNTD